MNVDFSSLWDKRRRAAPLVLVAGVLFVGRAIMAASPSDVPFILELESPSEVTQVRLRAIEANELVSAAEWSYRNDAPARLRHSVSLAPGDYTFVVDVVRAARGRSFERRVHVPSEGAVVLREDPQ